MIAALKEITRLFVLQLFLILAVITLAMTTQAGASSPKIVAISAGPAHCLALGADGTVWEWGSNWRGELTGI